MGRNPSKAEVEKRFKEAGIVNPNVKLPEEELEAKLRQRSAKFDSAKGKEARSRSAARKKHYGTSYRFHFSTSFAYHGLMLTNPNLLEYCATGYDHGVNGVKVVIKKRTGRRYFRKWTHLNTHEFHGVGANAGRAFVLQRAHGRVLKLVLANEIPQHLVDEFHSINGLANAIFEALSIPSEDTRGLEGRLHYTAAIEAYSVKESYDSLANKIREELSRDSSHPITQATRALADARARRELEAKYNEELDLTYRKTLYSLQRETVESIE